jgi:rod shape-determining protein MreD
MMDAGRPPLRGGVVIVASFAVALVLAAMPVPDWAVGYWPDWASLVLIYWCLATPHRVSVGRGWLLGLTVDIMQGSLLGQNALAKTVVAFLAASLHLRVRMFPMWQQSITVLVLIAINQGINLWIKGMVGGYDLTWIQWMPAVTSALIWPWLFVILRDLRRYARVT